MVKVTVVGEPNYELFERGVRMMFASLTPEQRKKYAHKVDQNDDEDSTIEESSPESLE